MRISEVSRRTGLSAHAIRYYEKEGLLRKGHRRENNYRHFDESSLYNLQFIQASRELGFSLEEIRDFVRVFQTRKDHDEITRRLESKLADLDQKLSALKTMRKRVAGLLRQCRLDPDNPKPELKDLVLALKPGAGRSAVARRKGQARR